jgi:hypothetical protein
MKLIIRLVGLLVFTVGAIGFLESRRNSVGHRSKKLNFRRDEGRSFGSRHSRSTRRLLVDNKRAHGTVKRRFGKGKRKFKRARKRSGGQFRLPDRRKNSNPLDSNPKAEGKGSLGGITGRHVPPQAPANPGPSQLPTTPWQNRTEVGSLPARVGYN